MGIGIKELVYKNKFSSLHFPPLAPLHQLTVCKKIFCLSFPLYFFSLPIVFLLDREEERDHGKTADGKDVAQPDRADTGDTEQAQEHHRDDIVPGE